MKLTKSKLKQIIKEELQKAFEGRGKAGPEEGPAWASPDAGVGPSGFRDEWGTYETGDLLKYGEWPWFRSYWREQILETIKQGGRICKDTPWPCVPGNLEWRRVARELMDAGINRPGEEADALIADVIADLGEGHTATYAQAGDRGIREGKKDEDWIQPAEEDIEKRGTKGVCTGDKFGGPTCKPGTKRYNLAKTFRKMAKDRKKK
jgi:hypothetical protein